MTLTPADAAAVALALAYAAQIDVATASGSTEELTKALFLGPHLLRVLESLGGTPAGRKASKTAARPAQGSSLTALRDRHASRVG